ncbi:signal peptide-domain containing protein [Rhodopirellula maiorica SM1]|uniref:Signal peptide-domain containing protein n=1 Tax=Rhodopirellula maiorica SM1 TaxID=1265738 RepID=M5RAB1_9BACT|nr:hypothetical protein [Rhodopirellula maiorica]EMI16001.1 signal peptide-domain containing protein [Rhodopirellula maiorica SM1]
MKSKSLFIVALLLSVSTWLGCGSSGVVKPTDEQNAFASVEGLGDLAGDDEMFASAFVAGAAPENRKDYGERGYQVNGEPSFDGDTVTVPVKIFGGVHATSSGDGRGGKASSVAETEQVWTLQRTDGQWKIKDAPLG